MTEEREATRGPMRWIGLNDGYVSADGRFLVAKVTVRGRRGESQQWALYGVVHVLADDDDHVAWQWTSKPIYGPRPTKGACQEWALASGYVPERLAVEGSQTQLLERMVAAVSSPSEREPAKQGPKNQWNACQECGVTFIRKEGHRFLDYCGPNCFHIVCERIEEIRSHMKGRVG